MKKIKSYIISHLPTKRRIIQLYAALLYNANLKGYITGNIFTGLSKGMCVPGMNCYSCPGATYACPLGSLQNAMSVANKKMPFYIGGIILLYCLIFGRFICGFLCPFGLVQDLLYKFKTPKLKKSKFTYYLSYLKYVLLVFLVIIIPIWYGIKGIAVPAFCKYVCPVGVLEGALLLLSNSRNEILFSSIGPLFTSKIIIFSLFVIGSIFIYRLFCRFICPLGAIYSLFNKYALLGVKVDESKCTNCGKCIKTCKVDIRHVGDKECINCGDCISVCQEKAITWKNGKFILPKNEVEANVTSEKIQAKRKKSQIILSSFLGITLVGSLIYYNHDIFKQSSPTTSVNENICPDFSLEVYNNSPEKEVYTLSENLGKTIVINFWATWCGPCVKELPHFEKVYNEYLAKNANIEMIAIHGKITSQEPQAFINAAFPNYKIKFLQDEMVDQNPQVYNLLGGSNNSYPMTVFVNSKGEITDRVLASVEEADLREYIDKALNS